MAFASQHPGPSHAYMHPHSAWVGIHQAHTVSPSTPCSRPPAAPRFFPGLLPGGNVRGGVRGIPAMSPPSQGHSMLTSRAYMCVCVYVYVYASHCCQNCVNQRHCVLACLHACTHAHVWHACMRMHMCLEHVYACSRYVRACIYTHTTCTHSMCVP